MILRKGQIYYRSEVGHYNIHYPSTNMKYELLISVEVEPLPWLVPEGFKAYRVIAPQEYLQERVLWIES
jgi:hypothetical protein